MNRSSWLLFGFILFTSCDSIRHVAIESSKTKIVNTECGSVYYSLTNGFSPFDYDFHIATSFESQIADSGLIIFINEYKIEKFESFDESLISSQKRYEHKLLTEKSFYFRSIAIGEVKKVKVFFTDLITCNGNFLELDSLIIAPIQIIED